MNLLECGRKMVESVLLIFFFELWQLMLTVREFIYLGDRVSAGG